MIQINNLISVIVPVYNVEKYLKRCINSILGQTYNNFELILIDDGSPDNSGNICDEYVLKDSRVKVIHKENTGVSDSRNIGIGQAKGEYLTFIDSDDYISSDMLEIMYNDMIENNAEIVIGGRNIVNESDGHIIFQENNKKSVMNSEQALKELMIEKNFNCVSWGKLYKKELFNDYKFCVNTIIAEDLELLYKIFPICNKIVLDTTKGLYFWTNRSDSVTKSEYNDNWKKEIQITEEIIHFFDKEYHKIKKYAIQRYVRISIKCMYKCINVNNVNEVKDIRNNIKPYIFTFLSSNNEKIHHKISFLLAIINVKLFVKFYKKVRK